MTTQNQFTAQAKSRFNQLPTEAKGLLLAIFFVAILFAVAALFGYIHGDSRAWGDRISNVIYSIMFIPIIGVIATGPYWIAVTRHVDSKIAILVLMVVSVPLDVLGIGEAIWLGCLIWALAAKNSKVAFEDNIAAARAAQPFNPSAPPPILTVTKESPTDVASQLKALAELKDQGILTEEEFNSQKSKILDN